MATKVITAFFTSAGIPTTGLTPTIDIWEVSPDSLVVNDGALVEIGGGWYKYTYASYDFETNYVFTIDGNGGAAVPLAACDRYKYGGNDSFVEDIAYQVWEEDATIHMNVGTTGLVLNQTKADTTTIIMNVASLTALVTTLLKYQTNRTRVDPTAMTLTVYDDDCVTPLIVFDLLDSAGNPSVVEVCERKPTFCP